jgi:predicted enzyme involved in methoxymalonyl-ACP biosynthesis
MTIVAYDDSNKVVCGVITFNIFKGCTYVRSLYIEPFYIRQGIGSSLLQSCIDACRENDETKMIRLEVLEKNIPARSLYETFGFKYKNFKTLGFNESDYQIKDYSYTNLTTKFTFNYENIDPIFHNLLEQCLKKEKERADIKQVLQIINSLK